MASEMAPTRRRDTSTLSSSARRVDGVEAGPTRRRDEFERGRRYHTDEEPERQAARRADGPGAVAVPQLSPIFDHARRAELQR